MVDGKICDQLSGSVRYYISTATPKEMNDIHVDRCLRKERDENHLSSICQLYIHGFVCLSISSPFQIEKILTSGADNKMLTEIIRFKSVQVSINIEHEMYQF